MKYKCIVFDAAGTLIDKTGISVEFASIAQQGGHPVDESEFARRHKLLSEVIKFPDRTSKEFYLDFNQEVFRSFGIEVSEQVLLSLYSTIYGLPWKPFVDTAVLADLNVPMYVVSNFRTELRDILNSLFGDIFEKIFISEELKVQKPDTLFYKKALAEIPYLPSEILYIGDSIKLDMEPARSVGMSAYLIDRLGLYKYYKNRLDSFVQLRKMLT